MAAEFSISLVVSAVTGAAVSALSELGGTVKSLSKAGNVLQAEHARLGRSIDTAMGNGSKGVGKMIGQYYQLGDSVKRMNISVGDILQALARHGKAFG
ncbi:hypothetical protein [uncultured Moraxella sp.]|uniref:hypothetical protein n=1 Tax=uncultured Moraxella sp. TaxID=263769 RepID=UPI0025F325F1|nr:hypothetical protein [uncultured Moraxella sp.]